ncbi:helix-turn-helix domain-containing protein [Solitalea canadensis]|uniref:Helix-turn-helix protein n=1 Tax=Solitalea canadensis (strain ATCC 29591 / DSM 3403 / JCM 21819 / LMG 8368 / NBRC 15130 / NCIMB 12057 / USAM 9D) TaxID=929556 RepID=H8KVD3_SOLCM|nr:helix-turn-helix transcriptional regulator [Solitalea canadensis]AFD06313.1 Helix-turn-helix protein [Solitalea canadensis DSM 3403]
MRDIIESYENSNWNNVNSIDNEKIEESDIAELIAEKERVFINKRKELIKEKLKGLNISQQELGQILGHKSKTHMSELMNGISPFSLKDLIIINYLLKIDMNDLVPVFLSKKEQMRIRTTIESLNKSNLRLIKADFSLV